MTSTNMIIETDNGIISRLTRIETKIDALVDHEKRIRALEKEQWLHRGGLAVVTFIAAKLGLGLHIG